MHPAIIDAVKQIEELAAFASVLPDNRLSRAYRFVIRCEAGMRRGENYVEYEKYFDISFDLLRNFGIVAEGK